MRKRETAVKTYMAAAIGAALSTVVACSAGAQDAEHNFEPLVRSMADRLQTADAVALSKWDSGKPVYDPQREAQVIANAQAAAPSYGVSASEASTVFSDQIEANKTVQFALLNQWRRASQAPSTARRSLTDIRRQLDQLQTAILQNLATMDASRSGSPCKSQVAKTVGRIATNYRFDALHLAALDRAAASVCRE
jgi:chorismate mutase